MPALLLANLKLVLVFFVVATAIGLSHSGKERK